MNINSLNMNMDALGIQRLNSTTTPQTPSGSIAGNDFVDMLRRSQGIGTQSDSPLPRIPAVVQDKELFEAALDFENILVQNLIRGMRNTVQRTNLIDTGFAGEVFEDMLFNEYSRIVTRNAGFGFAEMIYRELTGQR